MRLSIRSGIVLVILTLSTVAFAGNITYISFNYSGDGFTGSGYFTTTDQHDGSWLVTDVKGQQNGIPFAGVEALNSNPGFSFNNLVFLNSTPQLDINGVLLSWDGGDVNLGYYGEGYALWRAGTPADAPYQIDFQAEVSSAPEPSTLLTLGSSLLGLAGLARKRLFR